MSHLRNETDVNIWAIVPAAGIGRRMGATIPKQYLTIGSKRVIDWTLDRLLQCDVFSAIYVAISASDTQWSDCEFATHALVHKNPGGAERADSVRLSLTALRSVAQPNDWVLVHDAARPCVHPADILNLINQVQAEQMEGGLLGAPVADTLKSVNSLRRVEHTVDRSPIWRAFTPQMFRIEALYKALICAEENGWTVTDDASAMEQIGVQPLMVEGRSSNIKITQQADLLFAQQVLS